MSYTDTEDEIVDASFFVPVEASPLLIDISFDETLKCALLRIIEFMHPPFRKVDFNFMRADCSAHEITNLLTRNRCSNAIMHGRAVNVTIPYLPITINLRHLHNTLIIAEIAI